MYVATSRARKETRIFLDREALGRSLLDGQLLTARSGSRPCEDQLFAHLANAWSRVSEKVNAIDFLPLGPGVSKALVAGLPKSPAIER